MAMTIVVTRNLPGRFGGFLASCMQIIAPGVYASPDMTDGVRERVWQVMIDWSELVPSEGGIVLFWADAGEPSGMAVRMIGWPKKELIDHEGMWLTVRGLTAGHDVEELRAVADLKEPARDAEDPVLPHPVPADADTVE